MINKIICPTDLSKTSINAVEYAAKLAQISGAGLLLVNIQHLPLVSIMEPSETMNESLSNVEKNYKKYVMRQVKCLKYQLIIQ